MGRVPYRVLALTILAVCCLSIPASAENELGNTVTAYVSPGATKNAVVIELWMENVNPVIGITVPLKFATGGDSLALDSLFMTGGRAAAFTAFKPVYKSANKTLLVNMLWRLDTTSTVAPIPPGSGPLMWIYMSTPGDFPLDKFQMASVQIPPENVLLYVTESLNAVNPDFELKKGAPPKKVPEGITADGKKQK